MSHMNASSTNQYGRNWYIEYDYKTLNIIQDPKFRVLIFKQAQFFNGIQGPISSTQQQQQQTPDWISQIAEAVMQILVLLYNFFNVEYKLSKNQSVKTRFNTICSVLKIENQYCNYFKTMSLQFRINRILACTLRLNRFMSCIVEELRLLQKHMDQTLLDNLDQVYLFMQQRIKQTLQSNQSQGKHDLNLILLDNISLLLRNSGDPTMKGVLDINKQKQIIEKILKSNEIYDQFMIKKIIELNKFQKNKQFRIQMQAQQDPNLKKKDDNDQSHSQNQY